MAQGSNARVERGAGRVAGRARCHIRSTKRSPCSRASGISCWSAPACRSLLRLSATGKLIPEMRGRILDRIEDALTGTRPAPRSTPRVGALRHQPGACLGGDRRPSRARPGAAPVPPSISIVSLPARRACAAPAIAASETGFGAGIDGVRATLPPSVHPRRRQDQRRDASRRRGRRGDRLGGVDAHRGAFCVVRTQAETARASPSMSRSAARRAGGDSRVVATM